MDTKRWMKWGLAMREADHHKAAAHRLAQEEQHDDASWHARWYWKRLDEAREATRTENA